MCCCCGAKICMLCTCLVLVAIVIGSLYGFGVFERGFHKAKTAVDDCNPASGNFNATRCSSHVTGSGNGSGRPFFSPPPPFN